MKLIKIQKYLQWMSWMSMDDHESHDQDNVHKSETEICFQIIKSKLLNIDIMYMLVQSYKSNYHEIRAPSITLCVALTCNHNTTNHSD